MFIFIKILPVLVAVILILMAVLPERHRNFKSPVLTDGEIISSVSQRIMQKQHETLAFAPIVRYQTEQGEHTGTARLFVPEWQYHYHIGEKIRICYEKTQPEYFEIHHGSQYEIRKLFCLTGGCGILLADLILWLLY